MHKAESLGIDLLGEKIDPCCVATRPREARNEAESHRVAGQAKHDRDRCSCGLGGERSGGAPRRGDYGDTTLDKIGYHRRQALEMALQPVVFDDNILTFGVASFTQALAECSSAALESIG